MDALSGEYYHQLDGKNRIRIPSRLKKILGSNYSFARGDNHCVYVYPKEEIERIFEAAKQIKISDIERQAALRAFTRTIVPATEDGQGRVVLTPELRKHLKFEKDEKDIVVIGVVTRAEIWSKSNYVKCNPDDDSSYDSKLAKLDF